MATENVSKLIPSVIVGAPTGQAAVSKLVTYYIVNTNTPPAPPTGRRRMGVSAITGSFRVATP